MVKNSRKRVASARAMTDAISLFGYGGGGGVNFEAAGRYTGCPPGDLKEAYVSGVFPDLTADAVRKAMQFGLGSSLRSLRSKAGISQRKVESAAGLPVNLITFVENGQDVPSINQAVAIAEALSVPPSAIHEALAQMDPPAGAVSLLDQDVSIDAAHEEASNSVKIGEPEAGPCLRSIIPASSDSCENSFVDSVAEVGLDMSEGEKPKLSTDHLPACRELRREVQMLRKDLETLHSRIAQMREVRPVEQAVAAPSGPARKKAMSFLMAAWFACFGALSVLSFMALL